MILISSAINCHLTVIACLLRSFTYAATPSHMDSISANRRFQYCLDRTLNSTSVVFCYVPYSGVYSNFTRFFNEILILSLYRGFEFAFKRCLIVLFYRIKVDRTLVRNWHTVNLKYCRILWKNYRHCPIRKHKISYCLRSQIFSLPQAKFPIPRMLCTRAVYFRNSLSASSQ